MIDQIHIARHAKGIEITFRRGRTCNTYLRHSWQDALNLMALELSFNVAPPPPGPRTA